MKDRKDRLDLTKKDAWTPENSEAIADQLNLPHDETFQENLARFIEEIVSPATIPVHLPNVAANSLRGSKNERAKNGSEGT